MSEGLSFLKEGVSHFTQVDTVPTLEQTYFSPHK